MAFNSIRLSTRITLGMLVLVAASALLWIVPESGRLREAFLHERAADLESALRAEKIRLEHNIEALRQNSLFLSNIPPISGMVRASANNGFDPRDKNSYTTWEMRMQEIFSAFLRAHPDYYQVRYIGVAEGGRELVRVDRTREGRIEVSRREALQAKGDRDYFKAGLALGLGRIHISEFNLNQEHGKIEVPHRPTLRAVTPVFDAGGHLFGMVVINLDVSSLLDSAKKGLPPGVLALIANQSGHYLQHPDAGRAFSFEQGDSRKITDDFPTLKQIYDSQKKDFLPLHQANGGLGEHFVSALRVYFDAGQPGRFLVLAHHIPQGVASQQVTNILVPELYVTLLAMLLAAVLFRVILSRTFAPLKHIIAAARKVSAGERDIRLERKGGGEIGELADALNAMLDKLSDSEIQIRENEFRKELIEALPGVFYMIDREGDFLMWNHNLEIATQRTREEILFSNPQDFFEGKDKVAVDTTSRRVFETGEGSVEATLVAKDGTKTPYYFFGRRVGYNGRSMLIGMGIDISAQRESMRATEALLRRNQTLLSNSMEGVHIMDVDGNLLEANAAFCQMLGYTQVELSRLNVRDWDDQFSPEELSAAFRQLIGHSRIFESVHKRKDGSLLDVEICSTGVEIDGKGYVFASGRDITGRKKLLSAAERHNAVIATAMDGYWMTNEFGVIEEVNEAYAKISGYRVQELVGKHISELEAIEKSEDVKAHIEKIVAQGYDRFETWHKRKDGQIIDIEISATYMHAEKKLFVFCHEITQRKKSEAALHIAAATFETQDATLVTDAKNNIMRANRAFTRITGYSAEEVVGKNPRIMSSGRHDKSFYEAMWREIKENGQWAGEVWDRRKNGEIYPKWMTITAVKNDKGETTQYVAIFSDITERKNAEEEIRNLAFYDALTQLPNRRLFHERFHSALQASARYTDFGAILFIDLDRFKVLNDTLGHDFGDLLLVEVANRIKGCVREMDTVARLGGDEFVVLLENLGNDREDAAHKAKLVAEKIRESLSNPYSLRQHEHFSSPSIGITLYHDDDDSMDTLMQHADAAMYQAKNAGRNAVRFYDPGLQQQLVQRSTLENDLRRAIENHELHLYYQVQMDGERRVIGAEALIRWIHPQRGMVSPADFIPVAEESSLIVTIGNWVLETGCAQLAVWANDERFSGLTLAVNVSAQQFHMTDFVEKVAQVLNHYQIEPSRLKLELTESVVVDDLGEVVEKMLALKALGVKLSLDDFGTGYSSLSYLKRLPMDQIKIDQSFTRGITVDPSDAVMVKTIIAMAQNFGLDVIAEGVETEAQFAFLKQHHCMAYQGYLFSKPVPVAQMEELVERLG